MWAGVGIVGAVIAISLTGVATSLFSADKPQREVRNLYCVVSQKERQEIGLYFVVLGTQTQVTRRHFPMCSLIPVKKCGTSTDLHAELVTFMCFYFTNDHFWYLKIIFRLMLLLGCFL